MISHPSSVQLTYSKMTMRTVCVRQVILTGADTVVGVVPCALRDFCDAVHGSCPFCCYFLCAHPVGDEELVSENENRCWCWMN